MQIYCSLKNIFLEWMKRPTNPNIKIQRFKAQLYKHKVTYKMPGPETYELACWQIHLHTKHSNRKASLWGSVMIDREESRKLMGRLWANNITSHPQQRTAHTPYLPALLHCIPVAEGQSGAAMGFERRSAWAIHWFAFNSEDTQIHTPTGTVSKHTCIWK